MYTHNEWVGRILEASLPLSLSLTLCVFVFCRALRETHYILQSRDLNGKETLLKIAIIFAGASRPRFLRMISIEFSECSDKSECREIDPSSTASATPRKMYTYAGVCA